MAQALPQLVLVPCFLLFHLATTSSAVLVNLTSDSGSDFCNGSEVTFTCETRGSISLEWRCSNFYIEDRITFTADLDSVNATKNSSTNPNTDATLTESYMEDNVTVLVSTLSIIPELMAPSGTLTCSGANATFDKQGIKFVVLAQPVVPQNFITYPAQRFANMMCSVVSLLRFSTNPADPNALTTYNVSVDGESVPYKNADFFSTDGLRYSTLVYNTSCGTHIIDIYTTNICGESPELRIMLVSASSNRKCSVIAVIVGVVMVAFKYLLDLS